MVRCTDGTGGPLVELEPLSCPPTWPAVGVVMIQDQPPAPPSVSVYCVSRPFSRHNVYQRKGNLGVGCPAGDNLYSCMIRIREDQSACSCG